MKKICLTILLSVLLLNNSSFAQKDIVVDSLITLLNQTIPDTVKVNILNEIAWQLITNKSSESERYLQKAYTISVKTHYSKGLGVYYHYKGLLSYYSGNISQALDFLFKSYKIRKDINDKKELASSCRVIGVMFADQNLHEKALEYYNQSLALSKQITDSTGMASAYNNIGVVYQDKKKYNKAMANYKKALELVKNSTDYASIGLYYNNIANIYLWQKNYEQAKKYYFKSLKNKNISGDFVYLTTLFSDLATFYYKTGKTDSAFIFLSKSWKLAEKANLIHEQMSVAKLYSHYFQLLGNYKDALKYHIIFKKLNDSLINEANASKLTRYEMTLQIEKEEQIEKLIKEKQSLENEKRVHKQKTIKNILIIILIAVVILSYFLYRIIIIKKRDNKLLLEQKDEILEINEELKNQKEELSKHRDQIYTHRKALLDSITYAKQIQEALLPGDELFKNYFKNYFILYLPKEIISGDFYWIRKVNNFIYFAVADCTGHGTPGALLSMLGISFLNEIITKNNIEGPASILEDLRIYIKDALKQNSRHVDSRDGMDIALCRFNTKTKELKYSGANNPIYIVKHNEFIELEPTDNPIGIYIQEEEFKNITIQLEDNDLVYLFTDGFIDQVNGDNKKKYMSNNFKELIINLRNYPINRQKDIINSKFNEWKKQESQVDDVTILCVQI
ncbi:MAG: tetratricopeptide repeat protein [Chlorobi bacterium]|nr:tetratricopeptide repeat protein [Chlorobiota bacterium]